jgi:SAM-dependent methyltransferase
MTLVDNPWEDIFRRDGRVFQEPAPVVVEFATGLAERGCSRVLDLGCGNGRHVVYLARQGLRVCGMDNARTALHLAQQWLGEEGLSASLVLADMRRPLPFCDAAFDAVVSTQVIHHAMLTTVEATAREIERVLRRGGLALITVPAHTDPEDECVEVEFGTFVPQAGSEKGLPHHIFAPEELCALFSQFDVVDLSVRGDVVIAMVGVKRT